MEDPFHSFRDVTFAGVGTAQYLCDFWLWERLLNACPEMKAVIELGTDRGGFSLYLQSQCDLRGMEFHTYDVIVPEAVDRIRNFHKTHVFLEHESVVSLLNSFGGPIVLFCDNGNKPRELALFSNKVPAGSLVAVHDWGTETQPEDVPDWLEEVLGEYCDALGSITRIFRMRKDEGDDDSA